MLGSFSTRPLYICGQYFKVLCNETKIIGCFTSQFFFCHTATDDKPVFKIMHKFLFEIKGNIKVVPGT